ncbi:MAG: hypothetical protein PHC46_03285 [Clostridia bacterium]|nr:hypothetical protein [Clostridia bacterium]
MQNKNYCEWNTEEVKDLFAFVETFKQKNLALTYAFSEYAKRTNRKPNSVRNYYYLELNELENNTARQKELNIDLKKHVKQKFKEFTKEEEYKLVYYILQKSREGKSVRNSCLELSGNNVTEMIRYQNKFRSLLKGNSSLITDINKKLDVTMGAKVNKEHTNVLNFPQKIKQNVKNKLTDDELKGLFMGLVKLVKKSATMDVNNTLKEECSYANENLRKTIIAMRQKQQEIIKLSDVNKELSKKVKQLENKIIALRIKSIKNLNNNFDTKNEN